MTTKVRITRHKENAYVGTVTIDEDYTDPEIGVVADEAGGMADVVAMGEWDGPEDYEWTGDEVYEVVVDMPH